MPEGSYFADDTIVAPATAPGGAIAVLRVSGPRAFGVARALLGRASPEFDASPPRSLTRAILLDPSGGRPLDDALFARFPSPASFTGEDVVEFHLHGGRYGVSRVLSCLVAAGARPALPGEFSFRAVRNGKLAITQAEAIRDLQEAGSDDAISLAIEKLAGSEARLLGSLAERTRRLAAFGELGIDFSDQDVEAVSLPRLRADAREVLKELSRLKESFARGKRIQDGVSVAILGAPNAGKSSLFNSLLGEERAIVTEIPGTTRDLVSERLALSGPEGSVLFRIEDTAGLRDARERVERIGVERAIEAAGRAEIVLFVLDPGGSQEEARSAWEAARVEPARTLGVLTRAEAGEKGAMERGEEFFRERGITKIHRVSNVSGSGISRLAEALVLLAREGTARSPGEVVLTREAHHLAVESAVQHMARAVEAPELDLFAADVRQTLHSLSPLIGETAAEDILGKIFSQFCIGK